LKTIIFTHQGIEAEFNARVRNALKNNVEVLDYQEMSMINHSTPDIIISMCSRSKLDELMARHSSRYKLKSLPVFVLVDDHREEFLIDLYTRHNLAGHFFPEEIFLLPSILGKYFELLNNRIKLGRLSIQLEEKQRILTRYVSSDVIQKADISPGNYKKGGEILEATILFFDIRKSTTIAEMIHPDIFSNFLSDLLSDIMDLIYGHGGHVNKLLGDGLLATFGCPTSSGLDAWNAVQCSIQIREYLNTYNDVKPDYISFPIEAGIGVSTGKVFAGDIGSIRKMEYTVLGDCVNTASRIEAMTKEAGVDILIDGPTYACTRKNINAQRVVYKNIRGKQNRVEVYYLKSLKTDFS